MDEDRNWSLYRLSDDVWFRNLSKRHIELAYSLIIRFEMKNWAFCGPANREWTFFSKYPELFRNLSEDVRVDE